MEAREHTVQYLTQKKKELTERREKLMRPIVELDKELAALSTTLALILREETPAIETGFPLRKIRGMTQTQAVIEIAKYNGGEIRSLDIKPILVAAKLMKNSKNAAHMVNGVINRSGMFERIGRGRYRLKESPTLKGDGIPGIFLPSPVQ
jgi:hypothetical protein